MIRYPRYASGKELQSRKARGARARRSSAPTSARPNSPQASARWGRERRSPQVPEHPAEVVPAGLHGEPVVASGSVVARFEGQVLPEGLVLQQGARGDRQVGRREERERSEQQRSARPPPIPGHRERGACHRQQQQAERVLGRRRRAREQRGPPQPAPDAPPGRDECAGQRRRAELHRDRVGRDPAQVVADLPRACHQARGQERARPRSRRQGGQVRPQHRERADRQEPGSQPQPERGAARPLEQLLLLRQGPGAALGAARSGRDPQHVGRQGRAPDPEAHRGVVVPAGKGAARADRRLERLDLHVLVPVAAEVDAAPGREHEDEEREQRRSRS